MAVLEPVKEKWKRVGRELYIPKAAMDVIQSDFDSDIDRLRAVIRYWLMRDPYASWRRLIWRFDGSGYNNLRRIAESLRNHAEKLTGMYMHKGVWPVLMSHGGCALLGVAYIVIASGCALPVHKGTWPDS
jgi:hypothetical protein